MKQSKELEEVLEEFANLLAKGKAPPLNEFLNQYPKLAAKLRPQLESVLQLTEAAKSMPEMPERLKRKLHNQFWSKVMAEERKRLLAVKRALTKQVGFGELTVKKGIDILLLLLQTKEGEVIRGITRIMKLLFLLEKETGCDRYCPDYYQFTPYKLGPFSPKVYEDLKLLIELGFVRRQDLDKDGIPLIHPDDLKIDEGFRFNEVTTIYTLTELGREYAEKLAKGLKPEVIEGIRQIRTRFAAMPLKELLGYVYQRYPEYTTQSEILEKLLR